MLWKISLTERPTLTVKSPGGKRSCADATDGQVPLVETNPQAHCWANTHIVRSGFEGMVSVTTSVWKAATAGTTRVMAGVIGHAVSSFRAWGFATAGPVVGPGRRRSFRPAWAATTTHTVPLES